MKANERLIIALVFFAVLTLTVILAVKQEAPTESAQELFARYENLSEDELFELKKKDSKYTVKREELFKRSSFSRRPCLKTMIRWLSLCTWWRFEKSMMSLRKGN